MNINELPIWEMMQKKMTWAQLGDFSGKRILDFGSGQGAMAAHYAETNTVIAIEQDEHLSADRFDKEAYIQMKGGLKELGIFEDGYFDVIFCHNVLEYMDEEEKEATVKEFNRVLKAGGTLSVLKHNVAGRVMQMAVLVNQFDAANALLSGENGMSEKYGEIRYFQDADIIRWCPEFTIQKVLGQRVFWDLQQNQDIQTDEGWQTNMLMLESRVCDVDEYKNIAFFHHVILVK